MAYEDPFSAGSAVQWFNGKEFNGVACLQQWCLIAPHYCRLPLPSACLPSMRSCLGGSKCTDPSTPRQGRYSQSAWPPDQKSMGAEVVGPGATSGVAQEVGGAMEVGS